MELAGQPFDVAHGRGHRGYAMAALLVGMSVMAVLMGALLPVWTHMATREKEEELIFRGRQYARAIGLYEALGFEIEGRIRREIRVDDEYHDSFTMGRLIDG